MALRRCVCISTDLLLCHPPSPSQADRPWHHSSTRALSGLVCLHVKPTSLNFILLLHNGCSAYWRIKLTSRWEIKLCAPSQKELALKLPAGMYCKCSCCRKIAAAAPSIPFLIQSHVESCSSNLFKGMRQYCASDMQSWLNTSVFCSLQEPENVSKLFISMNSILLTYFKFMQGLATVDLTDVVHS